MRLLRASRGRVRRAMPRWMVRDWVREYHEGTEMFDEMEVGSVVVVQCNDFPYVGRVVAFTETRVTLADAVRVLWDGRHGEFSQGKPPSSAEVERTYPLFHLSVDAVIGWGIYPGGEIPKPQ